VFISKRSVNLIVYVLAAAMNFELIDAVVLSAEPHTWQWQVQRVLDGLRYWFRKVKPNDKDAINKYNECNKIVNELLSRRPSLLTMSRDQC